MAKKSSYNIPTQPYVTPQQAFELNPDTKTITNSQDFTRPEGFPNDYVPQSTGGNFYGLVGYNSTFTPTSGTHIVYKSWVEGYVSQAIVDLIAEGGGLGSDDIRNLFSSSANTPLTYNSLTGVFTLDKNLASYTNNANFITLEDLPAETDPVFTAWDKSTGISITKSQITDLGTPLTVETDPIFIAHPAYDVTAPKINNWDTAYSWGNHALAGYKTSVSQVDVTQHQEALSIAVSQLSDVANLNIPNDLQDLGFPTIGTSLQLLRINSAGTALEFFTIQHSDLGGILGGTYHLDATTYTNVNRTASSIQTGLLSDTDWNTFNNKLDSFTPGNLLSFNGTTLNVDSNVLPANDDVTSASSTWSSNKIQSVINGTGEESLGKVYTIRLASGATVAQRLIGLVEGTDYPTGWVLSADSNALVITHNLATLASIVKVFSKNGTTSDVTELQGNVAYATFTNKYGTGYDVIRLDALATITTELYLKIII